MNDAINAANEEIVGAKELIDSYLAIYGTDAWYSLSVAERSELRTAAYNAQIVVAQGIKPTPPPPDANYIYEYVWRTDVGSTSTNYSGRWVLVRFPNLAGISGGSTGFTGGGFTGGGYTGGGYTYPGTGSGGGSTTTPQPPTPPPPPPPPPPVPVKSASIDSILFDQEDALPVEIMADLIFEDIGGEELINIARNDTINGQPVIYQPIKNLSQVYQEYNPNNILIVRNTSDKYFENFPIKFEQKIPSNPTGPSDSNVYIDYNGDLVIEAINLAADEQIELQIMINGTIYEVEL
jgi:hypothetical protein